MKNLVIQAQRLGDIVMSYPLFTWLKSQDTKEILVLGEKKFYDELLNISPQVTYIPTERMDFLKNFTYDTIINLSHREDTANLASSLTYNNYFGLEIKNSIKKIHGNWQLYRTSLTHNNHYNRFHWADLNALDIINTDTIKNTKWKKPLGQHNGKVGIFVGASEEAKRPSNEFWGDLAIQLCKKGYSPIFISGPSKEEKRIAYQCAKRAKIPHGVIPGNFSIYELIAFLQTLQLFITPDTGPMHIASFANVPTLNISLGPVHPWETAPYPPHHYIIRSAISCSGCWQCTKQTQLCRNAFIPHRIANLIHALLTNKTLPNIPNIILYKSSRNALGLYELEYIKGQKNYHDLQANFWRYFFLKELNQPNILFDDEYKKSKEALFTSLPKLCGLLQKEHLKLIKTLLITEKFNGSLDKYAWKEYPPIMRPLTSYTQLFIENNSYSKESLTKVMEILENFRSAIL